MKVTARFYGYIRQALGRESVKVEVPDGSTLADLIGRLQDQEEKLKRSFRADDRGVAGVAVVIGGRLYPRTEWEGASLRDDMVIEFLPPAIGGGRDQFGASYLGVKRGKV